MKVPLSVTWIAGLVFSTLSAMGCASAQIISSYDALRNTLKPGDRVSAISSDRPPARIMISGTVEAVSADSVAITINGARHEIPRATIVRLDKLEQLWRRSTLMGLAIGGGTGGAIAAFSNCGKGQASCGGTRARGTAGSALLGAAIGAALGAKWRTSLIYLAPERPQEEERGSVQTPRDH
jgi:hypothetical protein